MINFTLAKVGTLPVMSTYIRTSYKFLDFFTNQKKTGRPDIYGSPFNPHQTDQDKHKQADRVVGTHFYENP